MLLVIHLFNMGGYRLIFTLLEEKSDIHIVNKLDSGSYEDHELIEVKIPYLVPYSASWPEYKRYDGEIELNGVHYNYVKRKMLNDTLYLLCIPNTIKTGLKVASQDLTAAMSDITAQSSKDQKSSVPATIKPFAPEYSNQPDEYLFSVTLCEINTAFAFSEASILNACIPSPFQPPRA